MYVQKCVTVYIWAFGQDRTEKGGDQGRRQKNTEQSKARATHNRIIKINVYLSYFLQCLFILVLSIVKLQ